MKTNSTFFHLSHFKKFLPIVICLLFFFAYLTLSLIKHQHFLTGYDLGVEDQGVWSYSQLKNPISTTHAYAFTPIYYDHVEIIYALISPVYWLWNDVRVLIFLYVFAIILSALPIYLLAKEKKFPEHLSLALLISYLSFYGVQNAIWADVHSIGFGVCFLSWFLYFLYKQQYRLTTLFFLLAVTSKEDIALLTLMISITFYILERKRSALIYALGSIIYMLFIFGIYFPYLIPGGYRFQSQHGLLSDLNPSYLINSADKRQVILYALASFGFMPLLSPFMLFPFLGDLAHFFIIGNSSVTSAQGLFGHYRITLALLLAWPTIIVLSKYKKLQNYYLTIYLIICTLLFQYLLHSPLSYLSKSWFWHTPPGAISIPEIIKNIPKYTPIVVQNNITPHLTHRDLIFTLWPDKKSFSKNSPCGETTCTWFRWVGSPTYLLVDTSPDWDIRHFLTVREDYLSGLKNLESAEVIKKEKQLGTTTLYQVLRNPSLQ